MTIVPASIRNRNPGAQYPGRSARKFGSSSFEKLTSQDGVHKIATFPSHVQGGAALFDLLNRSYVGMTIEKAITKWCGDFYVSTYLKVLEDKGGVKRSDPLTKDMLRDPSVGIPLARAMAWQEAGRDYPMSDEEWAQAHTCAFTESVAPAFSPANDVPSPKAGTRLAKALDPVLTAFKISAPLGGGVGLAATLPTVPTVPVQVTDSIANLSAWQGVAGQFKGIVAAMMAAPLTFGGIAMVCVTLWFAPKLGGSHD
jgi:hypothetical protein